MAWTPIKLRKGGEISFVGEAEGAGGGSQPIQSGSGSPLGAVTPIAVGYLYVDLTVGALYQALGATSADWVGVGGDVDTSTGWGALQEAGVAAVQAEAVAGGAGASLAAQPATVAGAGGTGSVQGGTGAAGQVGGDASVNGGGGDGGNQNPGGIITYGGSASAPGRVQVTTDNRGTAPFGTGNAGEVLTADGAFGSTWAAAQFASGVPTGAPTGNGIAVDTTAVSGGIYVWDGAVWVKAASI